MLGFDRFTFEASLGFYSPLNLNFSQQPVNIERALFSLFTRHFTVIQMSLFNSFHLFRIRALFYSVRESSLYAVRFVRWDNRF